MTFSMTPAAWECTGNGKPVGARRSIIRKPIRVMALIVLTGQLFLSHVPEEAMAGESPGERDSLVLPKPQVKGPISVEEAISSRRTRRHYAKEPLALQHLAQLLWAAQGITGRNGLFRTAPSAGALYPLDVYAVVGKESVEGLDAGVYQYVPKRHTLRKITTGDLREEMARAAFDQMWMAHAPVALVVTAEYERIEKKYGSMGRRYALMEAGHACQNIFLQAEALGLAAGIVGAFDDTRLAKTLHLLEAHRPLIIMPVGHR